MKKHFIPFLLIAAVAFSFLTGCNLKQEKKNGLSIVTTCFPPYDFARAVKGNSDNITMLLSPGAEAHSYEPAPMDILKIQQCDVFIYIGGEDEVWVEDILDSIDKSKIKTVKLIDYVDLLSEIEIEGSSGHEHDSENLAEDNNSLSGSDFVTDSVYEDAHDHIHDSFNKPIENEEEYDDHIWTSPQNAAKMVQAVSWAFINSDSENQELYKKNADDYISELQELHNRFAEVSQNSANRQIILADRFPFRYLANDYDINCYAAFSGCSSESEPGVYTMAFLINKLLEMDTGYVFYLDSSTKRLAEKLSDATGAKMLPLYSCHNISKYDFNNGTTYIDLMNKNLENLREAFS